MEVSYILVLLQPTLILDLPVGEKTGFVSTSMICLLKVVILEIKRKATTCNKVSSSICDKMMEATNFLYKTFSTFANIC